MRLFHFLHGVNNTLISTRIGRLGIKLQALSLELSCVSLFTSVWSGPSLKFPSVSLALDPSVVYLQLLSKHSQTYGRVTPEFYQISRIVFG